MNIKPLIRFKTIYTCAIWMDGVIDGLKIAGLIPKSTDYFLVRIEGEHHWQFVAIDEQSKNELDHVPHTMCNKEDCEQKELEQIMELRMVQDAKRYD